MSALSKQRTTSSQEKSQDTQKNPPIPYKYLKLFKSEHLKDVKTAMEYCPKGDQSHWDAEFQRINERYGNKGLNHWVCLSCWRLISRNDVRHDQCLILDRNIFKISEPDLYASILYISGLLQGKPDEDDAIREFTFPRLRETIDPPGSAQKGKQNPLSDADRIFKEKWFTDTVRKICRKVKDDDSPKKKGNKNELSQEEEKSLNLDPQQIRELEGEDEDEQEQLQIQPQKELFPQQRMEQEDEPKQLEIQSQKELPPQQIREQKDEHEDELHEDENEVLLEQRQKAEYVMPSPQKTPFQQELSRSWDENDDIRNHPSYKKKFAEFMKKYQSEMEEYFEELNKRPKLKSSIFQPVFVPRPIMRIMKSPEKSENPENSEEMSSEHSEEKSLIEKKIEKIQERLISNLEEAQKEHRKNFKKSMDMYAAAHFEFKFRIEDILENLEVEEEEV